MSSGGSENKTVSGAKAEIQMEEASLGTSQKGEALHQEEEKEEEPLEKGLCFFIDNDTEEWTFGNFYFVQNHELEFLLITADGKNFVKETVNYANYNMNRGLVGAYSNYVNRIEDWKPKEKMPVRVDGSRCELATITAFSNREVGGPALWLQFPTLKDFVPFYKHWLENVCQRSSDDARDNELERSIEAYEVLKERHEREEREKAARRWQTWVERE